MCYILQLKKKKPSAMLCLRKMDERLKLLRGTKKSFKKSKGTLVM